MVFLFLAGAYLLGSVSFALLFSRLFALPDPRGYGSGNLGATNVARGGGKMVAILTLLADAGKGAVAVLAARAADLPEAAVAAAGCAWFWGMCFRFFCGFVAGAGGDDFGGVLLLGLWIGGAAVAVWLAVFAVSRFSSLASLVAAPTATVLFAFWGESPVVAVAAGVMSALVVFRHRENIDRLLRGEENRFGSRR